MDCINQPWAQRLRKKVDAFAKKQGTREQAEKRYSQFDRANCLPQILDEVYGQLEARHQEVQANFLKTSVTTKDGFADWYHGAKESGGCWAQYRDRLSNDSGMRSALNTIDSESSTVVGQLANPLKRGDRKKGLVLGYVQSGKTANYAAVIAKAVDAGYKMIIVLSGMYTALRQQTQLRLERDLAVGQRFIPEGTAKEHEWFLLTSVDLETVASADGDMNARAAKIGSTSIVEDREKVFLAVVKKNTVVLQNVSRFLKNMRDSDLATFPVLIIDDESDQATPNTEAEKNAISTINKRIRTIWESVKIGSYVAYTATPFANLLMDPNDEFELYPSDFFIAMKKPDGYYGALEYFGRREAGLTDKPGFEPVLDAVREIPDSEVKRIEPKKRKGVDGVPEMVPSLRAAIDWFIVATAIRRLRNGERHSTMLVHTSMKTSSHQSVASLINAYLDVLQDLSEAELLEHFEEVFSVEYLARLSPDVEPGESWGELEPILLELVQKANVIVDNSESDERLQYDADAPATTIVVGGNTLSRGLTLEGLVCSYFARVSQAADTLAQMGRWFGYRPGYEDLVRVWMSLGVRNKFTYIADIESELREEAQFFVDGQQTPGEIGVRMRTYPGVLELTSNNKMYFAHKVDRNLQGVRLQTQIFENDLEPIAHNWQAFVDSVAAFNQSCSKAKRIRNNWVLFDVPSAEILAFLDRYNVHEKVSSLQPEVIGAWINKHAMSKQWNVVLVSPKFGKRVELVDGMEITLSKRTRTITSDDDATDIRAVIAPDDVSADIEAVEPGLGIRQQIEARRRDARGNGLLLLYLIDKYSAPSNNDSKTRCALNAPADVPLFGLIPPFLSRTEKSDGDYVSVKPESSR